jgi:hypothetical protein
MKTANHKFKLSKKFSWLKFILQIIFWLVLAYFAYILLITKTSFIFLDNLELLLHEAGHFLFSAFGNFLSMLGGTIGQIVFPVIFIIYFFYYSQYYSGSIMLFWLGQDFINISYYIKDARAMKLELIGDIHDWNYLLGKFNLLEKDTVIGQYVFAVGAFLIVVALLLGLYSLFKAYKLRNK